MSVIEIGKLKGKYVVYWYEDPNNPKSRRRFRLQASNRKDAWAEGERVYESQMVLKGDQLTLHDVWGRYRRYLEDRKTGKDLDNAWKHVGPQLGAFHPLQIDDDKIKEYLAYRRTAFIKRNGRPPANDTLYNEVNLIQSALNHAYKKNLIEKPVHLKKPPRSKSRDRWLKRSEISRLMAECVRTPHLHVATALMLGTAGRVTAILEARWDHVDFQNRTIDLRTSDNPHSKKRAFIPLNEGLHELLLDWKEHCDSPYVVEYKGGGVKNINRAFSRAANRAGLDGVHPHVLRHTAAVHMVASGCDMARVSQYMGHSSVSVTERIYARFAPDHLRDEAAAIDFLKD